MSTRVYVKECDVGRGLFALKPIRAGEMILAFGGDVITADQVRAMGEQQGNTVQIESQLYIDVEPPGQYTIRRISIPRDVDAGHATQHDAVF